MVASEKKVYEAMLTHHETLKDGVELQVEALREEVAKGNAYRDFVSKLTGYLRSEVIPHAVAEEYTIYKIAKDRLGMSLVIDEMTSEHRSLADAIATLNRAPSGIRAVELSEQLLQMFSQHVAKENDLILPRLLADPEVDLVLVSTEMHELFEAAQSSTSSVVDQDVDIEAELLSLLLDLATELGRLGLKDQASRFTASAWALLESRRSDLADKATVALHRLVGSRATQPVALSTSHHHDVDFELDVRQLAPAKRHMAIFTHYRDLQPGSGFMLINDHDPKPLKYQFEAEYSGEFTWDYLEGGPKIWRVRIGRPLTRTYAQPADQ